MAYTVATYLEDRAYGGPEEGGWWYTRGELLQHEGVYRASTYEAAAAIAQRVNARLDATENAGRPPISSMASRGRYRALVHEGTPPAHYPEHRPHYE